jgi:hypothetical protein
MPGRDGGSRQQLRGFEKQKLKQKGRREAGLFRATECAD